MNERKYQICTNCVMDTSDPQIQFDDNGCCDFCDNYYNTILPSWHRGEQRWHELETIAEKVRKSAEKKKYDCIIGMSGGVDSCYLTHIVTQKLKLRPLLVTVDTGWNLNVANENVQKLVRKYNLDLETITIDYHEIKSLQLAFLKSAVPYQDLPQDCGLFAALYDFANLHNIKYIFTGGNYATEGVKPPREWTYFNDVRLIKDINKRFGSVKLKKYPLYYIKPIYKKHELRCISVPCSQYSPSFYLFNQIPKEVSTNNILFPWARGFNAELCLLNTLCVYARKRHSCSVAQNSERCV